MSLVHSPSIVTNGLVLYYDMNNTQKSFKGAPTTNYVVNPTTQLNGGEFCQYTDLAPIFNTYGLVPYSLSLDMKTNASGGVLVYMQNGSTTKYSFVSQSVSSTTIWQRFTFNNLTPAISDAGATAATLAFYTGYGSGINPSIKNVQVELGAFATPFIAGTRSNTQALIDLTGQNTLSTTSLTYASDNTFSFNGSSDYMDMSTSLGVVANYTISFWARRDAESRMPVSSRTGTSFYWYGDNSWAYTHGGVWGERYYAKPTSIPVRTWGHYCVVYNGANVTIYRQGVYQDQAATTGTADFTMGLRIGYWAGGSGYQFNGVISSLSFYNRALSAAEVAQNFQTHHRRYGL